ncbi:MAG: lipoyl(octanoyl) transferase LipB [Dehalococcoidia bacterium]
MSGAICDYAWLGRVEYVEAWEYQQDLARKRALGEIPDTLLLLEHPPVFTTGRRGPGENLRLPEEMLGAPLVETDRGGDITFHGPGQLIAYPIIDLRAAGLSVVSYVRALEETIIRTVRAYGIEGVTECGLTGVWVGDEKIAAIGVRAGRPAGTAGGWVTTHGLALNVNVDLGWFARIVPCGIVDRGVTSIEALTAAAPSLQDVARTMAGVFGEGIRCEMRVNESLTLHTAPLRPA